MAFRRDRLTSFVAATCIFLLLWWLRGTFLNPHNEVLSDNGFHKEFTTGPNHVLNPIDNYIALPQPRRSLPKIQYDFSREDKDTRQTRLARLEAIKDAMVHSWNGYRQHAWLMDELAPVTGGSRTTFGSWGVTLVDALDTLWLMNMEEEFEEAIDAVRSINFNITAQLPLNIFEATIRYLGGLLGAYDVSEGKYPILLDKAKELGDMLYGAFDTHNHMPVTKWSRIGPGIEAPHSQTLIAELGTLSLEFTRLTQLTGDPRYYDAIQRVTDCMESQQNHTRYPGLFPQKVNAKDCYFFDGVSFSIDGSSDSVYEYFAKEYQLLSGAHEQYKKLYEIAKEPTKEAILFRPMTPAKEDILLAGTVKAFRPGHVERIPQVQHLACFAGGMFALAAKLFKTPEDMVTAKRLVDGCIWAYNQTDTGIMPEMFRAVACPKDNLECPWDEAVWAKDVFEFNRQDESAEDKLLPDEVRLKQKSERLGLAPGISAIDSHEYVLRPEALESIFVLYRITGDETLRDAAWDMFQAITRQTRTEYGYTGIDDVTSLKAKNTDRMESFWMAETLKYMWLLFEDPDVVSLDDWVLNTEAHPFRLSKGK